MKNQKTHIFLVYSVYSAAFFALGVLIFYLLPENSLIYRGIDDGIYRNITSNLHLSFSATASTFADEVKYPLFIFVAVFTARRNLLFISLLSYKGFMTGAGLTCVMRAVKQGIYDTVSPSLLCFVYSAVSVSLLGLLCYFCVESIWFSKKLIYPPKLRTVAKRRDTVRYIFIFFAVCGALLLITIIKHGNLLLMISPKG